MALISIEMIREIKKVADLYCKLETERLARAEKAAVERKKLK